MIFIMINLFYLRSYLYTQYKLNPNISKIFEITITSQMHSSSKEDLLSLQSDDQNTPNPKPSIQQQLPHKLQSKPIKPNLDDINNVRYNLIDREGTPAEMRNFINYWSWDKIILLKQKEISTIQKIIDHYQNIIRFYKDHAKQFLLLLIKHQNKRKDFMWTIQNIKKYQTLMWNLLYLFNHRQKYLIDKRKREQIMRSAPNISSENRETVNSSQRSGQISHKRAQRSNQNKKQESFWSWMKQLCCCFKKSESHECKQCLTLKSK